MERCIIQLLTSRNTPDRFAGLTLVGSRLRSNMSEYCNKWIKKLVKLGICVR